MTIEEKLAIIETIYIETAKIQEIMEDIEEAMLVGRSSNYFSQPSCTLIMGLSGVGKTSLREHFERKYPRSIYRDEEKEQTVIPILSTTLTDDNNPKAAPGKMLRDLGDALEGKLGSRAELGDRFVGQIQDAKTEAIFIDEFQHAFEGGGENRKGGAANWIKTLINQTKRPVVLFGMPWCIDILEKSSELKNRFDYVHLLDEFGAETESFKEWLKLLEGIDKKLPFEQHSNLSDPKFAYRLLALSGGNLSRLMKKVIKPAARKAAIGNESNIGLHRLLAASKKHLGIPEEFNPLAPNIPLDKIEVKHLLTPEEDEHFKGHNSARNYVIVSSGDNSGNESNDSLADIFRPK
jgi:hypothetical protein